MMRFWFTAAAVVLVLISGVALYQVKYRVEERTRQVEQLEARIIEDGEAIRILRAEWAYLTNPTRLQDLNDTILMGHLGPALPRQVLGSLDEIPMLDLEVPEDVFGDDEGRLLLSTALPRAKPLPPVNVGRYARAVAAAQGRLPETAIGGAASPFSLRSRDDVAPIRFPKLDGQPPAREAAAPTDRKAKQPARSTSSFESRMADIIKKVDAAKNDGGKP